MAAALAKIIMGITLMVNPSLPLQLLDVAARLMMTVASTLADQSSVTSEVAAKPTGIEDLLAAVAPFVGMALILLGVFQLLRHLMTGSTSGGVSASAGRSQTSETTRRTELPTDVAERLTRLRAAAGHVADLAAAGHVTEHTARQLDTRIRTLTDLLHEDARTRSYGGATSDTLLDELDELTELTVAVADAAVETQATMLRGDRRTPVTLDDARITLDAHTDAHRELDELAWPTATGGA